jgi:hypothetical protein
MPATLDQGQAGFGNIPGYPNSEGTNNMFFTNQPIVSGLVPVVLNNASGQTLTTAQMIVPLLDRTGSSTPTDTTPTAAALVAALPGVKAGSSFEWSYRNRGSGTATLAGGTGVTSATGNTLTVATLHTRRFLIVFVTVTPGSEAITIYSLGDSAH